MTNPKERLLVKLIRLYEFSSLVVNNHELTLSFVGSLEELSVSSNALTNLIAASRASLKRASKAATRGQKFWICTNDASVFLPQFLARPLLLYTDLCLRFIA